MTQSLAVRTVLAFSVLACACGREAADVPLAPTKTLNAVVVTGSCAPWFVGTNCQMTATAEWSDGSRTDITAAASWTSSNTTILVVSPGGLSTFKAQGQANVSASYQGATGVLAVSTLGRYRVYGSVRDNIDRPVAGVLATVVEGPSTGASTVTDVKGAFQLFGISSPIRVNFTKAGYTPSFHVNTFMVFDLHVFEIMNPIGNAPVEERDERLCWSVRPASFCGDAPTQLHYVYGIASYGMLKVETLWALDPDSHVFIEVRKQRNGTIVAELEQRGSSSWQGFEVPVGGAYYELKIKQFSHTPVMNLRVRVQRPL